MSSVTDDTRALLVDRDPAQGFEISLGNIERVFGRVLDLVRAQLGMDIAWISQFSGGEQRLREVRGDGPSFGVERDWCGRYEESYCSRVVVGDLPDIVRDAKSDPLTRDLPVTAELDIGAYIGVPVTLRDGTVYGMLCSLSHDKEQSLGPRDVKLLNLLAQVVAEEVERERQQLEARIATTARIRAAIQGETLNMVFQPIVELTTRQIVGAEALARFAEPPQNPATWFAEALSVGVGSELELAAVRLGLAALGSLPRDVYVSVNVSPQTACSSDFQSLLAGHGDRVLVEVTEQAVVDDYETLLGAMDTLRAHGAKVAIDDAGAGHAGLERILRLRPDVIKLDMALTRDIDSDPAREALARALIYFSNEIGATIIAEGLETAAEMATLSRLGIPQAQGYFLARPGPLPLPTIESR